MYSYMHCIKDAKIYRSNYSPIAVWPSQLSENSNDVLRSLQLERYRYPMSASLLSGYGHTTHLLEY
jgi:hypothetical protein